MQIDRKNIKEPSRGRFVIISLSTDIVGSCAAVYLLSMVIVSLVGPIFLSKAAEIINLGFRHRPPFSVEHGLLFFLGADSLGRSMVARLIMGGRTTILISITTVSFALLCGVGIGVSAGLSNSWVGSVVMRIVDLIMSIPTLLLAIAMLYSLGPVPINVVAVLALARTPIFARTARAETLEIRERGFVYAARVMGASRLHILRHHILPLLLPTLLAIAALELATVMLAESALTFLGIGIQPPSLTWGLMVSEGQEHLQQAWWISIFPGSLIASFALCATLLGNWFRVAGDPSLRPRLGDTAYADD